MTTIAYRHGLPLPTLDVTLDLRLPASGDTPPDLAAVDAVLVDLLDVPAAELPPPPGPGATPHDLAAACLQRVLLANAALLRIGLLPCFAPGAVLALQLHDDAAGHYRGRVAVPFYDALPAGLLKQSLQLADTLVRGLAGPVARRPSRQQIDRAVQRRIVKPVRAAARGGVSTVPIIYAALAAGLPVRHLGAGSYQLGWGAHSRVVSRSALDTDSAVGTEAANRKDLCARVLALHGMPVPDHQLVDSAEQALQVAQTLGWPVVVKPADRERSEGVTTRIDTPQALQAAYTQARRLSPHVLVERQVVGPCYRLLVAGGRFLYCVERGARALTGDGQHSIATLLEHDRAAQAAAPSWLRKKTVEPDAQTLAALQLQGYSLDTVPAQGAVVRLRVIESTEWSETSVDVTDRVAPANRALAERAARALGLGNAGIDLMTSDIAQPWYATGGVVTEVNFRPHFGATLAARSRMGEFLRRVVPGDGRIRIEVLVGDTAALQQGTARLRALHAEGVAACLCNATSARGADGPIHLQLREPGLYGVCRALLLDRTLQALLVVVHDDELLSSGLPFDRIADLQVVNRALRGASMAGGGQAADALPPQRIEQLLTLLRTYCALEVGSAPTDGDTLLP